MSGDLFLRVVSEKNFSYCGLVFVTWVYNGCIGDASGVGSFYPGHWGYTKGFNEFGWGVWFHVHGSVRGNYSFSCVNKLHLCYSYWRR